MCANGSTSTVRDSEPVTAKAPPREEPSLWGTLFSGGNMNYIISFGFRQGYYSTLPPGYARGNFTARLPRLRRLRRPSDFGIMVVLSPPTPAAGGGGNMDMLISFIVFVAANVVSHCVSKWLDRHSREQ